MKKLSVRVESVAETKRSMLAAVTSGLPNPDQVVSFLDYETMYAVLTPKRLAVLTAMTGQGPVSIREISRRIGRDFKGVHSDVTALIKSGFIDRTADGISFPYDAIHVEFEVGAAA